MEDVTSKPKTRRKHSPDEGQKPVHTVTVGSLVASIYLRQAPSGYAYFAYNVRRSYQSLTTRNQAFSTDFFAENESDLIAVVTQASLWIARESEKSRDQMQNAA